MKRLILAGAGHAHLHVLKALTQRREPGLEVLLISPHARQLYSGMLPGWIAGHYALEECAARLEPLIKAAGARFVQDHLAGLDADRGTLDCDRAGRYAYDLLSIDTGAPVDVSWLAATGARLLPIRPLEGFAVGWNRLLDSVRRTRRAAIAVVGGGAAGVELALAMRHRLDRELGAGRGEVSLAVGSGLMAGHGRRVAARVRRALNDANIDLLPGRAAGAASGLTLADGSEFAADCIVAATRATPPAWLAGSGLALAADGFIAVNACQQSVSHAQVFAAGDIATRADAPPARSGVHAVRAGPVLAANLARMLAGQAPLPCPPRRHVLYLLAAGSKEAIMSWHGLAAGGHWAWRWKDWIDRRFLRQYDSVLGEPS